MQMTELDRPTMEDRTHLEEQIKELENKLIETNSKLDNVYDGKGCCVGVLPLEVETWIKELRILRRYRDNELKDQR